jgi:predicted permease
VGLWSRLRKTFSGARHEEEIQEELQFHLHMAAAEGNRSPPQRLPLGNVTRMGEETRAVGVIEWLDSALRDARYGLRQLRRTPILTLAVVLSLALGVGANTAIFTLVDAALLRPLPVNDPAALRIIEWTNSDFPEGVNNINGDLGPAAGGRVQGSSIGASLYRQLAREQSGFEALIAIADPNPAAMTVGASPAEQVSIQYVSENFFQGLGTQPALGRPFRQGEDRVGQEPVVIVSHRFWISHLGGDRNALNGAIRVNNVPARIVGVAPPGFFGLRAGQWTDVYAPLAMRAAFLIGGSDGSAQGEDDRDWWVRPVARLKPGVPEAAARAQAAALFRGMAIPEGARVEPQNIPELIALPGRRGFNALDPMDASALWILMLLVGVLLLIVCANIANLLLSRSVARQHESAVRLSLGAGRARLIRQHLIESGLLAVLGGLAGLAVGYLLAGSIHFLFQTGRDASNAFDLHLHTRVLGYTGAVAMLTALLFGVAPAVQASRADLNDALKVQARSVTGGRVRLPRAVVAIQIGLCLTALVAAGLLIRSFQNLRWTDVGFDRETLAYASVNPWQAGYSPERVGPYADRLREELARIPGVLEVSTVQVRLLGGGGNVSRVFIPGRPKDFQRSIVKDGDRVNRNRAGVRFFATMRIPFAAGRVFTQGDMRPNADAVIVDERFVRQFFPNTNPLGRRFGLDPNNLYRYEIVGVVKDSLYNSLRNDPYPTVYEPYVPAELRRPIHFAIRAGIDSGSVARDVRKAVASVDPAAPLTEFHTQTALIDRLLRTERLLGFLSGAFGAVALILAGIGVGGLLAYGVSRRTSEIGVRVAVGATPAAIIRMVLRDSFWSLGIGILLGLPCAYAIGRILKSVLFRLQPLDAATIVPALLVLVGISLWAAWIPARQAAGLDPIAALRQG